jgi:hypothetical protein
LRWPGSKFDEEQNLNIRRSVRHDKNFAISDIELGLIYSPLISTRFDDVDLVISCGDLPYFYLELHPQHFECAALLVRGNHAARLNWGGRQPDSALGWDDLHQQCVVDSSGLILCVLRVRAL